MIGHKAKNKADKQKSRSLTPNFKSEQSGPLFIVDGIYLLKRLRGLPWQSSG